MLGRTTDLTGEGRVATPRWPLVAVAVGAAALAVLLAVVVPIGQPYDEPSHWDTVRFYATELRMPELGAPGVTYEAQMGPVYYALAAVVDAVAGGDGEPAFYGVRIATALLAALLVVLTHRLARLLVPGRSGVALAAAAVVGVAPTVVLFTGSVSNDAASVAIALGAAVLAVPLLARPPDVRVGWWRWAAVGLAAGLAVLTKVHALALVPAVVIGALAVPAAVRRRAVGGAAVAVAAAAATCGWWFVRNAVLYGDLTGRAGVDRTGVTFPRQSVASLRDLAEWGRSVVSVAWVPTEYHRNAYDAPLVLRGGAVLLTAAVVGVVALAGWRGLRRWRRGAADGLWAAPERRGPIAFAASWAVITVLGWAVLNVAVSNLGPRSLAVVLPPIAIGVAVAVATVLPTRLARAAAIGVVAWGVGVSLWCAAMAAGLDPQPPWIRLSG